MIENKKVSGWSVVGLILVTILLIINGILIYFSICNYDDGDYAQINHHGLYAVENTSGIIDDNSAIVTDSSLELSIGLPVVFKDNSIKSKTKLDILYVYSVQDESDTVILAYEKKNSTKADSVLKEVDRTDLRGVAITEISYLGWLLKNTRTLRGFCILLSAAFVFLIIWLILLLNIIKCKHQNKINVSDLLSEDPTAFINTNNDYSTEEYNIDNNSTDRSLSANDNSIKINEKLTYSLVSGEDDCCLYRFTGEAEYMKKLEKLFITYIERTDTNEISLNTSYDDDGYLNVVCMASQKNTIDSIIRLLHEKG